MNRLEYCASFGYYLPIRQNRWLRLPSDSRQTLYTSHIKYPCLSVCLHACQSITPKRKVRDPRPIYILNQAHGRIVIDTLFLKKNVVTITLTHPIDVSAPERDGPLGRDGALATNNNNTTPTCKAP